MKHLRRFTFLFVLVFLAPAAAHAILAAVPELGIRQPATAIGKTWPLDGSIASLAPDGRGFRFSLRGILGLNVGWDDGIELTLAGLTAAIDLRHPARELPGIGRTGMSPV